MGREITTTTNGVQADDYYREFVFDHEERYETDHRGRASVQVYGAANNDYQDERGWIDLYVEASDTYDDGESLIRVQVWEEYWEETDEESNDWFEGEDGEKQYVTREFGEIITIDLPRTASYDEVMQAVEQIIDQASEHFPIDN